MLFHDRYSVVFSSPLGQIGLAFNNEKLTKLALLSEDDDIKMPKDAFSRYVITQFSRYFKDPLHQINIELDPKGTLFQQRVWKAMRMIPSGKTLSYGQLAKQLQTYPRAIGQACRTNPLPIIVPCHRIVGATDIGGYSGAKDGRWLQVKKWLLAHEQSL